MKRQQFDLILMSSNLVFLSHSVFWMAVYGINHETMFYNDGQIMFCDWF